MPSWEFPAPDPVDLQVRIPAGHITIEARHTQNATVTLNPDRSGGQSERLVAATRVEFDQGTLSVVTQDGRGLDRGSLDAVLELPEGSSCTVNTASADVSCTGPLSAADIHTASGDVSVEQVTGLARVVTASGDVQVGAAAELTVDAASGDVNAGSVVGDVTIRTASGDVEIEAASGRRTDIKATSGDISVAVRPGIRIYMDISTLSGTVSSDLDPSDDADGGPDMALTCRTLSGDVQISRATQPAAR